MKSKIILSLVLLLLMFPNIIWGQKQTMVQGTITSKTDGLTLIGVSVTELDATNRIVSGTITDVNGHYILKIKSPQNRISFSFIGFDKVVKSIDGKSVINVAMTEIAHTFKSVEIKAIRKRSEGGFNVPIREVSGAVQTIDTKEFEGLQVSSIDDALQGRIAGLDIVATSGDPGSGSSMRIRGASSINANAEPLIVVNGVPFESQSDQSKIDYANATTENFAALLSINPDDIQEIIVLKDGASAAVWGIKGANGVIEIKTKKGAMGPTRVSYRYTFTGSKMPKGMNLLNGGEYTMLMKQSYFNRFQREEDGNIPEFNYDQNYVEYENFNNNTDWVKEVTQIGTLQEHNLNMSGGGERATFRVSAGYTSQNGTIIGTGFTRYTNSSNLEYNVSDRIKFTTEFSLTNTITDHSNGDLLNIARLKMPNVSVYKQDANGNNTDVYYNIPISSELDKSQRELSNPVALAHLASKRQANTRIIPKFKLDYDLLDPEKQKLKFSSYVSFDLTSENFRSFLPQSATNDNWDSDKVNNSSYSDSETLNIYTDNNLAWEPKLGKDHSVILYGSVQNTMGSGSSQNITTFGLPYESDASNEGYLSGVGTGRWSWRSLGVLGRAHYSYKSKYNVDLVWRRDGSTKFGMTSKFGDFPSISGRWNISDEGFMKGTRKWLSMFSFRPSWGVGGNQPKFEYMHFSRYGSYGSYLDDLAIAPTSLRLNNLKWETSKTLNLGSNIEFLDGRINFDLNYYKKHTTDLLMPNVSVPSSSGFSTIVYKNSGIIDNDGYEINVYSPGIIKTKDWRVDINFNIANNRNTIVHLDPSSLKSMNYDFNYKNGIYLQRVQPGNALGSIYGFRYKGVYQYDKYIAGVHEKAPVSRDVSGRVNVDKNGDPLPMYFNYNQQNGGERYQFRGGDAIYEDINHDGSIDKYDIVYLGNSNPKLNGGFNTTITYKNLTCKLIFVFRYGNKNVNIARMNAENMYSNDNQSTAVNWRWAKDGDITEMPRALYASGYNWLGSDRYVEDGSFLRFKYLNLYYSAPKRMLKKFSLNSLDLFMTLDNILVFTKYTGVDPELPLSPFGVTYDNNKTPRARTLQLGIKFGL